MLMQPPFRLTLSASPGSSAVCMLRGGRDGPIPERSGKRTQRDETQSPDVSERQQVHVGAVDNDDAPCGASAKGGLGGVEAGTTSAMRAPSQIASSVASAAGWLAGTKL